MKLECVFCYSSACEFYKRNNDGRLFYLCAHHKLFFIASLKCNYKEIKKEELINMLTMEEALK